MKQRKVERVEIKRTSDMPEHTFPYVKHAGCSVTASDGTGTAAEREAEPGSFSHTTTILHLWLSSKGVFQADINIFEWLAYSQLCIWLAEGPG